MKFSWREWKKKLQAAFSSKRDYHETLCDMIHRKKRVSESYTKYYYEKMALLNHCKIYGKEAVSCLIGGIEDTVVRYGAKAGSHKNPESLFKYLNSLNDKPKGYYVQQVSKAVASSKSESWGKADGGKPPIICYKCGKIGHEANVCEQKGGDKRCSFCKRSGHEEVDCFARKKKEETKVVAILEQATNEMDQKYYKDIYINKVKSTAYVDLGSSCTTIRQAEIQRLVLKYDENDCITLRGYGQGHIRTSGALNFDLTVDSITLNVKAYVVPSEAQGEPELIGHNFTNNPVC